MSQNNIVEQFLNVSYLYFQLTGKTAVEFTNEDLEDWIDFINNYNQPQLPPDSLAA